MSRQKQRLRIEALIDSMRDSLVVVAHNKVETELLLNQILDEEIRYKRNYGVYYRPKDLNRQTDSVYYGKRI